MTPLINSKYPLGKVHPLVSVGLIKLVVVVVVDVVDVDVVVGVVLELDVDGIAEVDLVVPIVVRASEVVTSPVAVTVVTSISGVAVHVVCQSSVFVSSVVDVVVLVVEVVVGVVVGVVDGIGVVGMGLHSTFSLSFPFLLHLTSSMTMFNSKPG